MADSKITALTDGTSAQTGDQFVIARSGANYKLSADELGLITPTKKLFDSTLGVDTASIDTGANGIASGYGAILVCFLGQTADASANGTVNVTLNNDTGANYDLQYAYGGNTSVAAGINNATANWAFGIHGASGSTSYPGSIQMMFPNYTGTTFWKSGLMLVAKPDATAGNNSILMGSLGYRSTTAISRLKIAGAAANLKAGSRLTIYGLP